jgi:hypothetical protein
MSSLPKANWNGQTGGQAARRAQVSIGMHAHPKMKVIFISIKKITKESHLLWLTDPDYVCMQKIRRM